MHHGLLVSRTLALVLSIALPAFGCVNQHILGFHEVAAGCPLVPNAVFERTGIDAKLGASTFGKVATGDASLLVTPEIVSLVSQSVQDGQVAEAYICAAGKRGELTTPEQFEHARRVVAFYSTKPTPEQAMKFHHDFPAPKSPTKSEIISNAATLLASQTMEDRLGAIQTLHTIGSTIEGQRPIVVETLSKFVRDNASSPEYSGQGPILPDIQAAMTSLTSKQLHSLPPQHSVLTRPLDLKRTYLPGVKLDNCDLAEADLSESRWAESTLKFANLRKANFNFAHLEQANLSNADLEMATLLGANLDLANLRESNLRGANFQGAHLMGAILEGADLSGANFKETRVDGVRWKGAKICGTSGLTDTFVATLREISHC